MLVAIIVTAIGCLISGSFLNINILPEFHVYFAVFTALCSVWFFIGQVRYFPHFQSFIIDLLGLASSAVIFLPLFGIVIISGYEKYLGILIILMGLRNIVNMFIAPDTKAPPQKSNEKPETKSLEKHDFSKH